MPKLVEIPENLWLAITNREGREEEKETEMNIKLTAKELDRILSALNYQSEYFFTSDVVEDYGWEKEVVAVEALIEKLERAEYVK